MIYDKTLEQRIEWGVLFHLKPLGSDSEPDESDAQSLLNCLLEEDGLVPSSGETEFKGRKYMYSVQLERKQDDWEWTDTGPW